MPHNTGLIRNEFALFITLQVPPLIKTMKEVKMKLELLEALGDIQVAMKILKDDPNGDGELVNPVDRHYGQLECDINVLGRNSDEFQLVENYILSTHGSTHSQYNLEVMELFACGKKMEEDRFKDLGNKKLLFHGSRLSNWAGILGQGLRIAPPEAPPTGYMFGKGVYFADVSSKSANYCWPTPSKNVGLLMLAEVALGEPNELLDADSNADRLPTGKHSVKGLGKTAPDPAKEVRLADGTVVPMGPSVATGIEKDRARAFTLAYNEYIVYDVAQIKMRYLAKIKFNFAH
jgi:poly [ADP-ribose] polymerase